MRPAAGAWLVAVAALAGCAATAPGPAGTEPPLQRAGVPAQLPVGAGAQPEAAAPGWSELVHSPWLRRLVEAAVANNRDLRVALSNVQRAQAQLALADANRWPTLGFGASAARAPNASGKEVNNYSLGFQANAWEVDLFGRLASLSDAARAQLLASDAGRRAAELSLTAATLQAGLTVVADRELVGLTRQTLANREATLALTRMREAVGAASQLELQAQVSLVAQARAALAQLTRQQEQDRNALTLLLGQALPEPAPGQALADEAWFAEVPVGLSSTVLLRRPDVVQAEQAMIAAQADIAAARAAFWPTITLTAQAGVASGSLSSLFVGGQFAPLLAANAVVAVFDAGRRQAGVDSAAAVERIAQAQYEQAIQTAFRETADALAGIATWRDQLAAQRLQRDAARDTARLTDLKAKQGAASALEQLDAQRNLLAAEQAVVQVRLAELANRIALYKALGG
jgi:multidrug efflux system outer membrane protein